MRHDIHDIMMYTFIISVDAIYAGGADVLYNKFNVTAYRSRYRPYRYVGVTPVNPPNDTNSDYKCVVATGGDYWRFSRCNDSHRVVCQSG